jgi:hypothetical protein
MASRFRGLGCIGLIVEEDVTFGIQEASKSTLVELLKFRDKITETWMGITVEKPGGFILICLEP